MYRYNGTMVMNNSRQPLKAPFPWFGGKSRVADLVWQRFGNVFNYIEPFCGSCAVLLGRPDEHEWADKTETINDLDGFVANFWRATQADPEKVAAWADYPVHENTLHARHLWLSQHKGELSARLEADPAWYSAKVAGWWLWGISCWNGSGWCYGYGPWTNVEGKLVKSAKSSGITRQLPHLGDAGQGINRKIPHLDDADRGNCQANTAFITGTFTVLRDRLRRVRVCCGDWQRIVAPIVLRGSGLKNSISAVFLDPPYGASAKRDNGLYASDRAVGNNPAYECYLWCLKHGDDPLLRVALCGYDGEHDMPSSWVCIPWKAQGGMANHADGQGKINKHRERIWFSPHCLQVSDH